MMTALAAVLRVEELKVKAKLEEASSMWIYTKAVICNGQDHSDVCKNQKKYLIMKVINWVCTRVHENHEWISDWCEELVEDGSGPFESMVQAVGWHRAYRTAGRWHQQQERRSRLSLSLFMEVNILVVEEDHHGHACLGGGCLVGKVEKRAAERAEEADFRGADLEAGEGACRSSNV